MEWHTYYQSYLPSSFFPIKVVEFSVDQEAFLLNQGGGASYFLSLLPQSKIDTNLNPSSVVGKTKKRRSRIAASFENQGK